MKFGSHVSIAGSIDKSVERAKKLDCDTMQIFTRNPRRWLCKELSDINITNFKNSLENSNIEPVFSHMPYLPNLASSDKIILEKSLETLIIELNRCDILGIPFIVTHLGSTKGAPKSDGLSNIIESLNTVFNSYNGHCMLLLENTAGKNNRLGSSIEDLCEIVSRVDDEKFFGLCFDTCHAFAAGYDIRDKTIVQEIITNIDDCIGFNKLKLVHCNDSMFELGSGRDRHEHLGLGKIGKQGFLNLLAERKFRKVPFICETPIDERRDDLGNLKFLKDLLDEITNG